MAKNRTTTDNYNKDYWTANGIPQAGAEEVPAQEKQHLAQSEKGRQGTRPHGTDEIAQAMGRKPDDAGGAKH
jgi:hypothetical protein